MKRNYVIYSLFFLIAQCVFSQIESKYYPQGNAREMSIEFGLDIEEEAQRTSTMPDFDINVLIDEDNRAEISGLRKPYRFGKGFDTNLAIDLGKDGEETEKARIWSMEFYSKGALSINFVLEKLKLANGAELFLYNDSGTMIYGPVTNDNNKEKGVFLTDLVFGDRVTMYVREPIETKTSSSFTIKRVVHAYRGLNGGFTGGTPGASESCNNDLACFSAWMQAGRSVALVLLSNGDEHCSGCLVNTTDNSLRPYFLTAFHCADSNENTILTSSERNNAEDWMYKFGFRQVSCTSTGLYYNWTTTNGATFRAGWASSDFLLMELDNLGNDNNISGNITFAGWDRRPNTPTSGASIHHPAGDLAKISIENNTFQISSRLGFNNYWWVTFDDGVVQQGSSGSPLFNQDERVVGQLFGSLNFDEDASFCSQPRGDYGKFDNSWFGAGTNDTRLSNWLDPCGTGAQTTNTIIAPHMNKYSSVGCTNKNYTVYNLPTGSTISWSSSSNLQRTSSQGSNPASFRAVGTGSAWVKATITPPNGCGNTSYIRTTTTANGVSSSISINNVSNNNGWLYATANGASAPYTWIIYGTGGSTTVTTSTNSISYYVGCGGGFLQVSATNSCGVQSYGSTSIPSCSGGGPFFMTVYPNPTSGELTLELNSIGVSLGIEGNTAKKSMTATLVDFNGATVKSVSIKEVIDKFNLDVSDLKSGNYFLKITGKGIDETHQIIIE